MGHRRHLRFLRGRPPENSGSSFAITNCGEFDQQTSTGYIRWRRYLPYISAGSNLKADPGATLRTSRTLSAEGLRPGDAISIRLLTKTRHVPLAREIIVYPKVEPADEFFEVLPMITGEFESFRTGRGDDSIDPRVHAGGFGSPCGLESDGQVGLAQGREFSREDERKLRIVFDNPAKDRFRKKRMKMRSRWRLR